VTSVRLEGVKHLPIALLWDISPSTASYEDFGAMHCILL